jgi:16S rRNA C967 or C1407 C5-methylase (RsmB/RsmF family)
VPYGLQGGWEVVYFTCTLAPEEDEGVVDTILRLTGHAVTITPAANGLIQAPALRVPSDRLFTGNRQVIALWPHRLKTSGFFSAHFRKNSSLPGQSRSPPPDLIYRRTSFHWAGKIKNF